MPEREADAAAGSPLSESELDAIVRINADDPTAEVYAGYPTMTVRRLVAELRRLRLTWTATPPTEPGQYWLKTPKFWTPVVVEVYLRDDGLLGVSYCGGQDDLAPFDGQWAGPLSPPPTSPLPPPGSAR